MLSTRFRLIFSAATVFALAGSAALQPKPPVPEYVPNYAYATEGDPTDTTEAFGVIAVIEPAFGKDVPESVSKLDSMKAFRNALASSTYDLLLAKKIATKGPAPAIEEMTYVEKKETHLAFTSELQLKLECEAKESASSVSYRNQQRDYQYRTSLRGFVVMRIVEPQSKEMLWQKKVEIEDVPFESEVRYSSDGNFCYGNFLQWPVEHRNSVIQSLETQYGALMKKIDIQLTRGELASLSKQAMEIKSRKMY